MVKVGGEVGMRGSLAVSLPKVHQPRVGLYGKEGNKLWHWAYVPKTGPLVGT
jgi:hypothetical protein